MKYRHTITVPGTTKTVTKVDWARIKHTYDDTAIELFRDSPLLPIAFRAPNDDEWVFGNDRAVRKGKSVNYGPRFIYGTQASQGAYLVDEWLLANVTGIPTTTEHVTTPATQVTAEVFTSDVYGQESVESLRRLLDSLKLRVIGFGLCRRDGRFLGAGCSGRFTGDIISAGTDYHKRLEQRNITTAEALTRHLIYDCRIIVAEQTPSIPENLLAERW